MYVLKILYMINYNKQITTVQNMLLAVYVKGQREKFSFSIGNGITSMGISSAGLPGSPHFMTIVLVQTGSRQRWSPPCPPNNTTAFFLKYQRSARGLQRHCVQ